MEEQQEPFATSVLGTLNEQAEQLRHQWAERAQLATACTADVTGSGESTVSSEGGDGVEQLIRTLVAASIDDAREPRLLRAIGIALGVEAHRRDMSLQLMLRDLDLLSSILLHGAEKIAREHAVRGPGHEGLQLSRRITEVVSQLRLAAVTGYTQALSGELRERYRAIRHDLRNPLGTIKSAVALLTDETVPAEMRENGRVRAMVARNTSSLDQLIDKALGDTAAQLRAFDTPHEPTAEASGDQALTSGREKREDVARSRERPDFESGLF